jgi:mRNA interferase MazF
MAKGMSLLKIQSYLEWLKIKLYLDLGADRAKKRVVKRGEVYRCNL